MQRLTTIAEVRRTVGGWRRDGRTIALVPTMGALHQGHARLVAAATQRADTVIVSIFVNPTQFDRPDDLAAYPRDLAADERLLSTLAGAAPIAVFAPSVEEMYPRPPLTHVHLDTLTNSLCGASRPGHFDGVATVVTKLLGIVAPDYAMFGRKDRQQLAVVERLVDDLNLPVTIVGVPTVRDDDGVATSSRNGLLTADQRPAAQGLSRTLLVGLRRVRDAWNQQGVVRAADIAAVMRAHAQDWPGLRLDYAQAVDPATMQPPAAPVSADQRLVLAVAGFVGDVRLIDNVEVGVVDDEDLLEVALT